MRHTTRNLRNRTRMQKIRKTLRQQAKQEKKQQHVAHRAGGQSPDFSASLLSLV